MNFEQKENNNSNEIRDERLWKVMEQTLNAATVEQRRRRRWGILFKSLTFLYLLILLGVIVQLVTPEMKGAYVDEMGKKLESYTAVINLNGTIAADEEANADRLSTALRLAFKDPKAKGIIIRINSGGGSPVQSGYVYDEIKRLRGLHPNKKVYAVITDIGASGAYYIAAAADEIYADKASLVGSIGVTGVSFGFVDVMEKIGVERRLYTSGKHKAFLDPFLPMKTEETEFWRTVLVGVHDQFIAAVRAGRGDRLKEGDNPDLYSGLIWNGEQALTMGLIDGLGSSSFVAREKIGASEMVDFTVKDDPLAKLMKRLGTSAGNQIFSKINGIELK